MPKDYFEVVEEPEEVVSESERQAKVIEFVYQVVLSTCISWLMCPLPPSLPGDEKNLWYWRVHRLAAGWKVRRSGPLLTNTVWCFLTPRIIEEVIFKSCPTPLGKKQRAAPTDQMKTRDRVERIINDLFEFGVPIEVLFDVDDLVKAKNIPKVSRRPPAVL